MLVDTDLGSSGMLLDIVLEVDRAGDAGAGVELN